ncbi:hypothetical protein F4553_001463 [Allocatelliglobosispora scoriae]|uniref:DUF11 domain-containing protein n=1 Tax=Allocatelliglobosispora scoriae TaxID=643052 RepID=A0A841BIJ1_9ACTN|nr:DUF11 domain-containing protein [Allocatelliglobosispora scoriae]MBB5868084.1 hypothetical protein [Allocatelliglobosispora scoriae]
MRVRTLAASVALAIGAVLAIAAPASAHPTLTVTASPTAVVSGTDTTVTISGTSNGNYTGARIDLFSTGGPGTLTSFTTFVSCGGGPTCTEVGALYRLALPSLTNGQAFSYTVTLTVDAATASTTFTPKAQFYTSGGSTTGAVTGPVITVTSPTTLTAAPATTSVQLGSALTVTLTATNVDNAARTYRITSADLPTYTTLGTCAGTPVATSTCTAYGTTGYEAAVAASTAGSGQDVAFTLNTTAAHASDTITAEVLVGGVVKATTTFTITVTNLYPDVRATKGTPTYNAVSQQITFRWNLTNIGTAAATGRTVTRTVTPAGLTSSGLGAGCTGNSDNETCPGPNLAPGASVNPTYTRTVALLALGTYTVDFTFNTPNDPNPANDTITFTCTVLTGLVVNCT